MSTSASSSSSLASTAASLTAPPTFTGVSKFATSLQQVLTRAVGIASLPLDSLQAGLTTFNNQESALNSLNSTFASLENSVNSIQNAVDSGSLNSTISDPTVASTAVTAAASAGTYTLLVNSVGSYSTALSNAGTSAVTDPSSQGISSATSFTLTVGTQTTTITPTGTSLNDLVSAINSQAGSQVQATVVNVGSTSSPDYRLSLQAVSLGTGTIDLQDSSANDLIASSTTGSLASYQVNGDSTAITSTSRSITIAPGLTANLLAQSTSGSPATITVANDPSGLASAFSNFATAYNAAATALTQQEGQSGGALSGQSLIYSLSGILGQLGNYSNGSASTALANYGITLDQTGQISVDTATFTSAANANFAGLLSTIGSGSTGGFLQAATNLLSGVEDPVSGLITTETNQVQAEITSQNTQIANKQAAIATLQTNLTTQISDADSTIAQLESQVSYVTGLFAQYTGATSTQSNGLSTL